jgi:hypothetical protein
VVFPKAGAAADKKDGSKRVIVFESLTDKLQSVFDKLATKGKLTEADVNAAMREVRLALLEAECKL